MMLSGRPLLATKSDQRYFVSRPELGAVVSGLASGLNTVLLGAPGSGKTTLLRQAGRVLADVEGLQVVYLNGSRFDDAIRALLGVQDALRGDQLPLTFAARDVPSVLDPQPADQLRDPALRIVRALRPERATVVMLDGLPPRVAHALFGQLRDDLWQTGITWALAGDVDHRASYLAPPADAFFESVVTLAPLTDEQQLQLIRKRCDANDPGWFHDVRVPSGNPRALLAVLRDAQGASDATAGGLLAARTARQEKAQGRGRLHSMVLAEIEDGAVVSASDEKFLDRFGISRQRAQQVLSDLEKDNLVASGTRPSPTSGRPRKMYWKAVESA